MDIVAGILLFAAAFVGIFPLTHLSMRRPVPRNLLWAHITLMILGILSLLTYALITPKPHKHWDSLGILTIAIIIGVIILLSGRNKYSIGLSLAYTIAAMFGILWLLTFIIPNT